ncbi:MarR family winged helix-turn-helix transcriptional regulator [Pseudalkalibacillus hwajinpoensis]|uniref:MarR family transcriptional regulator n=1 Tax=Guptibacillus hwajinpoensis TaxID=208199 RepID=A0A4U1MCG6_9BACL|nr:MarR family transcriptional regulator [Pseudalkalibacillus hwajinpoensis]TKD68281.1 MarR family transcriptional regulator [Pseudalkalibacillus hwajinpoensis]
MVSTNDIFHTLHQQVRYITKEMNEKLKAYNLYSSQWSILYCLDQFGPMKQTDIWQYLNVEAPTTTRTLARMEKNNWVVRLEGKDKRERIVQLTDNAKLLIPEIKESIHQMEQSLLKNLDSNEIQQFHTLLKKIGYKGVDVNVY